MSREVLAIVSARGGSKGVPGKNLKQLAGKPLIAHMIGAVQEAKLVKRFVFSTEDEKIAETARQLGVEVPFMREKNLSEDNVPLIAVTKDVVLKLKAQGYSPDIVVQLQPTCPFITSKRIDESVQRLLDDPEATSCVSLKRIEHEHPYRAKVLDSQTGTFSPFLKDIDVEKFQSRQDLPELFCTSGAIYTRRTPLLENWSGKDFCLGNKPLGLVLDDSECINIDRPIDFEFAEFRMGRSGGTT